MVNNASKGLPRNIVTAIVSGERQGGNVDGTRHEVYRDGKLAEPAGDRIALHEATIVGRHRDAKSGQMDAYLDL